MTENLLTVGDLSKANSNAPKLDTGSMKNATGFLQDLKGVLEIVRDISGVDIMGKAKEMALNAQGKQSGETSSNAVKIQAGIEKAQSDQPVIQKQISINAPKAMAEIKELLGNLDDAKTIKEIKEEFEKNQEMLQPVLIKFISGVTFLQ